MTKGKPTLKDISERLAGLFKEPMGLELAPDAADRKRVVYQGAPGHTLELTIPPMLSNREKLFITRHENLHRACQGLPPLTFEELFPDYPNG